VTSQLPVEEQVTTLWSPTVGAQSLTLVQVYLHDLPHVAPQVLVLLQAMVHESPHVTVQFGPLVHVNVQSFAHVALQSLPKLLQDGEQGVAPPQSRLQALPPLHAQEDPVHVGPGLEEHAIPSRRAATTSTKGARTNEGLTRHSLPSSASGSRRGDFVDDRPCAGTSTRTFTIVNAAARGPAAGFSSGRESFRSVNVAAGPWAAAFSSIDAAARSRAAAFSSITDAARASAAAFSSIIAAARAPAAAFSSSEAAPRARAACLSRVRRQPLACAARAFEISDRFRVESPSRSVPQLTLRSVNSRITKPTSSTIWRYTAQLTGATESSELGHLEAKCACASSGTGSCESARRRTEARASGHRTSNTEGERCR